MSHKCHHPDLLGGNSHRTAKGSISMVIETFLSLSILQGDWMCPCHFAEGGCQLRIASWWNGARISLPWARTLLLRSFCGEKHSKSLPDLQPQRRLILGRSDHSLCDWCWSTKTICMSWLFIMYSDYISTLSNFISLWIFCVHDTVFHCYRCTTLESEQILLSFDRLAGAKLRAVNNLLAQKVSLDSLVDWISSHNREYKFIQIIS